MSTIFEVLMVLAFGFAWPTSIVKSWQARSTKGKSLMFLLIIFAGYICGIIAKFILISETGFIWAKHYVLLFYFLNLIMVGIDLALYFRNCRLDRQN